MRSTSWTGPAQADLARIDDDYRDLNADYANRVGRAAIAAGHFLARHPEAGARVEGELRKWRVPRTRYILIYRILAGDVEILRVRHERENWTRAPL